MKKTARKSKAKKTVKKVAKKAVVKKSGNKPGKKRILTDAQIIKLKQMRKSGNQTVEQLCRKFKISVPTFYNYLKVKVK